MEDKQEPKGLLEGIKKAIGGKHLILEDRQNKINLLIEDRLGQIEKSTSNNRLMLDNGYEQFNRYIGNQKTLVDNKSKDNISAPSIPIYTPQHVERVTEPQTPSVQQPQTREIKKGDHRFRVSLDAQGELRTEKYQNKTNVYTKSSVSALQKSTGTRNVN